MSNITLDDLYSQAGVIKRAEIEGENTAERVGGLFWDIIDYLQQNPSGGSTPAALSHPLSDINLLGANPDGNDKILLYNSGSWGYADKPTGGGGGGITLTDVWNSLAGNDATKQINAAHLSDTLDNYVTNSTLSSCSWWGRSLINGAVTGNLEGNISSITFSNGVSLAIDSNNANTLRVYKANGDAANFYASGGVSALGVGVSGGGSGGDGATLNALLDSINENTDTLPTLTAGMTVMRNSNNTKWIASKLALNNLSDTSISSLSSGQVLVYRNGNWVNENYTPGTQGATTLSGLTDTTISSTISGGQILYRTGTGNWINAAFGITTSNNLLSGITFNGTSYSIADTKNTTGATTRNSTKLYLTGSETQASAPVTYTNSGCFVGTDNCLYSNSKKTVTADELATVQDYFTDSSAKKAIRLTDNATKTAWGQTYWSGGQPQNVSGDLSNVGNIDMDGYLKMNVGGTVGSQELLHIHKTDNVGDHIAFGYSTASVGNLPLKIHAKELKFLHTADEPNENNVYPLTESFELTHSGDVKVFNTLYIDEFPITYDSTNNALCFTGSIYATGGVSALGFQSTENGGALINGPLDVRGVASMSSNLNVFGDITSSTVATNKINMVNASVQINTNNELTINAGNTVNENTQVTTKNSIKLNSSTVIDGNGNLTSPSVSSSVVNADELHVGNSIEMNTTDVLVITVNGQQYKLDIQAAITAGIFTPVSNS